MASETHAARLLVEMLTDGRHTHALFLNVDGTLLDIASTPDAVPVPDGMPALIAGLSHYLGGALALISGRQLSDLDQLFSPVAAPCAGVHGAQIRLQADQPAQTIVQAQRLSDSLRAELVAVAASAGHIFEDKQHSVAIHFRDCPDAAGSLRSAIEAILDVEPESNGAPPGLIAGKMMFEVKHQHYDKGTALNQFMQAAPFVGRRPIMIGDDATDEEAFSKVTELEGMAFSVGQTLPGVGGVFDSPAHLRATLEAVLAQAVSEFMDP